MGFGGGVREKFSFVMRFSKYLDGPFSEGMRENIVGNLFGR